MYKGLEKAVSLYKKKEYIPADFRGFDNEEIMNMRDQALNDIFAKYFSRWDWVSKVVGVAGSAIVALGLYNLLKNTDLSLSYNLKDFLSVGTIAIIICASYVVSSSATKSYYNKLEEAINSIQVDSLKHDILLKKMGKI